ncbi:hypothetical protein K504DRAFT_11912 [Pleomassaria siparia CBS 279.74]|uniref:Uncharacterized protein n=1 Tax=Pleomassaria siparia CBS 279.74 TaxID=1314801 RepID=A0A6G1KR83_9PLEO|nr:hypothetical protein K504DRAFT_11912 [Pleomassaria siparia CBS 279.74]
MARHPRTTTWTRTKNTGRGSDVTLSRTQHYLHVYTKERVISRHVAQLQGIIPNSVSVRNGIAFTFVVTTTVTVLPLLIRSRPRSCHGHVLSLTPSWRCLEIALQRPQDMLGRGRGGDAGLQIFQSLSVNSTHPLGRHGRSYGMLDGYVPVTGDSTRIPPYVILDEPAAPIAVQIVGMRRIMDIPMLPSSRPILYPCNTNDRVRNGMLIPKFSANLN